MTRDRSIAKLYSLHWHALCYLRKYNLLKANTEKFEIFETTPGTHDGSKNKSVCKNAVTKAYYGSCLLRVIVSGLWAPGYGLPMTPNPCDTGRLNLIWTFALVVSRPHWEKCAPYVEGGADRWNTLSQDRSSDELVDVLLAEMTGQDIAIIQAGVNTGAEYFQGQVVNSNSRSWDIIIRCILSSFSLAESSPRDLRITACE